MRVLIIDDDSRVRGSLTAVLEDEGYSVSTASDGREGLKTAWAWAPTFVLCDVRMPGMGGLEFLEEYRASGGEALVIMITANGTSEQAVDAMKRGAYDYLLKPISSDEVVLTLRKAEEREKLWREVSRLRERIGVEHRYDGIVARSEGMRRAVERAERAAECDDPVLITGEAGTGKQRLGRMIHDSSARRREEFVVADCGAIPPGRLESDLLGSPGEASMEPRTNGRGLLGRARGGTLYLDEVADLPLDLQVRLEGVVGDDRSTDVRLVAAGPEDLRQRVRTGRFREGLLDRLGAVKIHLPPLRERPEDIPPLVSQLLPRFNRELGLDVRNVSSEGMRLLTEHPWPGNVEELENTLQRAMVLADGAGIDGAILDQAFWELRPMGGDH